MNLFSHLKSAALSDVGRKRKNNEDAFGIFPEAGIFCVADGMGGGDDGEIASAAVVRAVEETVAALKPGAVGGFAASDVGAALARNLSKASAWICHRAHERKLNGCGSTFVGVVFDATDPAQALAVHAGDSRLYLLRGRSITQITRDHSVAELMGEKDESKVNPMFRSMVVNGIGIRSKAEPEFTPFKVAPGDRVLVCSDGLSRMVPDKKILAVSRESSDPESAVRALIAAALEAGGVDNVTAVLVEVGDLPPPVLRLEAPPLSAEGPDAETQDDLSTEGGATGSTGGTMTCATILPGIAEETPFGEETPVEVAMSDGTLPMDGGGTEGVDVLEKDTATAESAAGPSVPERRGRIAWIAVAGLAVVAAVVAILIAVRGANACEHEAPVASETPHPPPVETNAVPDDATGASRPRVETNAVPDDATGASRLRVETNSVPDDATGSSRPQVADPFVLEFAAACEEKSVRSFIRALRHLGSKGGLALDFDEEADRFLQSARQLVRARNARATEAAAVDLRVLLLNAEQVHSVLSERRQEAIVAGVLSAWNTVLSGDPAQVPVQKACVRLVRALPEVRAR